MSSWLAEAAKILVDALAKLAPALAAYIAGKGASKAEQATESLSAVKKAKAAASAVGSATADELNRLRNKWTK